jgi:chromosome segregation ATPase
LELGKRLLVLKELTPHGEFEQRCQLLGFGDQRTRLRFMNAAAKTAKSGNLPLLATQVKSMSAFLELVTHDEDVLEDLSKLDDIDRMSASELRAAVRNLQGDIEAKDKVLDSTQKKLTKLQIQANKKVVADTDWPDALEPITDQIAAAGRAIAKAISDLETCRITLMETGQALEADLQPKYEAALGHVVEVYEAALAKAEREISKERVTFDKSLGAYGTDAA